MNKNFKVITINGIRGIITLIFIALGLIAGFIISPGWVCMKCWNYFFEQSNTVGIMNIYQGIMLWAIIALSLYALNNRKALIGFGSYQGLTPDQIKDIMQRARTQESGIINDFEIIKQDINMQSQKLIDENSEEKNDETKQEIGKQ